MVKKLVLILSVLVLAACVPLATAPKLNLQTPAQITAQICPPLTLTLGNLSLLTFANPAISADLHIADTVITPLCAGALAVTTANLQNVAAAALPALTTAIQAAPLSTNDKNTAILGLTAASIVVQGVIAAGGPAPAAPVPAASGVMP